MQWLNKGHHMHVNLDFWKELLRKLRVFMQTPWSKLANCAGLLRHLGFRTLSWAKKRGISCFMIECMLTTKYMHNLDCIRKTLSHDHSMCIFESSSGFPLILSKRNTDFSVSYITYAESEIEAKFWPPIQKDGLQNDVSKSLNYDDFQLHAEVPYLSRSTHLRTSVPKWSSHSESTQTV